MKYITLKYRSENTLTPFKHILSYGCSIYNVYKRNQKLK